MSIRSKIFLIFTILITAFTAAGAYVNYRLTNQVVYETETNSLNSVLENGSHEITQELNRFKDIAIFLASDEEVSSYVENRDLGIEDTSNVESIKDKFNTTKGLFEEVEEVILIDQTGNILISTLSDNLPDYTDESVTDILFSNKFVLENVHNIRGDDWGIDLIGRVEGSSGVIGAVIVHFKLNEIYDNLSSSVWRGDSGELYIVNRENQVVSPLRFTQNEILANKVEIPFLTSCFQGEGKIQHDGTYVLSENLYTFENYRDKESVGTYGYLKDADLCLVIQKEVAEFEESSSVVIVNTAVAFIIFIIFILFFSYLVGGVITSSIKRLTKDLKIIESGNVDHVIAVSSDDEVGTLAKIFKSLTAKLRDNQENLENKVQDKTSDLAKKIEEMEKKNEVLESTKSAMLNVMEDLEVEKAVSGQRADDLQKFKLAVDSTSDHIVITDPKGKIIYANDAAEKITGYKKENMLGKTPGDLWGGLMEAEFYKKMWDTITKNKSFEGELVNKRKNGEKYDAAISISPITDYEGTVRYYVGLERDITKAKEIDRAKSEFVSLASHQLRTPLSTIRWYVEILLSGDAGKFNKDQEEYLKEVEEANRRMVELVDALLSVSRIEMGTLTMKSEPVDLKEVAKNVLAELRPQIMTKKQKVIEDYHKGIPVINSDKRLMHIVIMNLMSNSVKYTPIGGEVKIEITIEKPKDSRKKDKILIKVSDTGMGIPEKQQPKIFTKLFRADNVKKSDTTGTGLGLYIVKSIVDHSKGKVWFKSKEGKGTTFFVELPVSEIRKKAKSKSKSKKKDEKGEK